MSDTFPKTWGCPDCGSAERLGLKAWQETHEPKDIPPVALRQQGAMVAGPSDLVPKALVLSYDICANCGREYLFKAELQRGAVRLAPPSAPMPIRKLNG